MTVPGSSYPQRPPHERGLVRAVLLAVLIHALLGLFLFYGIHWQNSSPAGAEAELWTSVPVDLQTPAPAPAPVEPLPRENVHVTPPLAVQSADIALEQQKRRQQEQEQEQRQKQAQEARARDAQLAEQRRQQAVAAKREQQRVAQLDEEQKAQKVAKLKAQQADARRIAQRQAREQKAAKEKTQAIEQAKKLDVERRARIAQMQQGLGGGADANGNGLARSGAGRGSGGRSYGADYKAKVDRLVHSNTDPWQGDSHLRTYVMVRCASDGTVLSAKITRHSSDAQWDEIALRAVRRSDPMPLDSDGKAPESFTVVVCPPGACPANN